MADPEFITFGCRLNTYETEVMRAHAGTNRRLAVDKMV